MKNESRISSSACAIHGLVSRISHPGARKTSNPGDGNYGFGGVAVDRSRSAVMAPGGLKCSSSAALSLNLALGASSFVGLQDLDGIGIRIILSCSAMFELTFVDIALDLFIGLSSRSFLRIL